MRFPRGCASKSVSFNAVNNGTELLRYDIELPTSISALDLNLLDNLVSCKRRISNDSKVCDCLLFLGLRVYLQVYLNNRKNIVISSSFGFSCFAHCVTLPILTGVILATENCNVSECSGSRVAFCC